MKSKKEIKLIIKVNKIIYKLQKNMFFELSEV